jgi:hypothetical protein
MILLVFNAPEPGSATACDELADFLASSLALKKSYRAAQPLREGGYYCDANLTRSRDGARDEVSVSWHSDLVVSIGRYGVLGLREPDTETNVLADHVFTLLKGRYPTTPAKRERGTSNPFFGP